VVGYCENFIPLILLIVVCEDCMFGCENMWVVNLVKFMHVL